MSTAAVRDGAETISGGEKQGATWIVYSWHHVAGTFNRGTLRIFVDGVPQPAATSGSTFGSGNRRFGYVGIGSESAEYNLEPRTPAAYVLGEVDDVRIYHRALLPGEITTLATP